MDGAPAPDYRFVIYLTDAERSARLAKFLRRATLPEAVGRVSFVAFEEGDGEGVGGAPATDGRVGEVPALAVIAVVDDEDTAEALVGPSTAVLLGVRHVGKRKRGKRRKRLRGITTFQASGSLDFAAEVMERFSGPAAPARLFNVTQARQVRARSDAQTRRPLRDHRPSHQVVRRESNLPHWSVGASGIFLLTATMTLVAALNDVRAFNAVATPRLYVWLTLCGLCTGGLSVARRLKRAAVPPPGYFTFVLTIGVAGAAFVLPTAWRVLTKADPTPAQSLPGAPVDLRNRTVRDVVYANADLRRAQLAGAMLEHVDMSGANLSEADLRNARLTNVELSGANLCGADLRGADLRNARDVDSVKDWAYAFYDKRTRMPPTIDIGLIPGPIPDTGRGLLYMCTPNQTRRIAPPQNVVRVP